MKISGVSIKVFHHDAEKRGEFVDRTREDGWYWCGEDQYPDEMAQGPFSSEETAFNDAMRQAISACG